MHDMLSVTSIPTETSQKTVNQYVIGFQVESAPTGPTLRDSAGDDEVLVGGLRPDDSLATGLGWRLWLAYDPLRIAGAHAIRLARLRFPAS